MEELLARARKVELAIFDVDGVMTDGGLIYGDDGREYKSFHSLDGHGLKMLKMCGVELAIITGRTSQVVEYRAKNIGIDHLYQGVHDKLAAYRELLTATGLEEGQTAYMGDDVVDLPILVRAGLSIAVPGAAVPVHDHVHYVTRTKGGQGAVREACELILRAKGCWDRLLQTYLS